MYLQRLVVDVHRQIAPEGNPEHYRLGLGVGLGLVGTAHKSCLQAQAAQQACTARSDVKCQCLHSSLPRDTCSIPDATSYFKLNRPGYSVSKAHVAGCHSSPDWQMHATDDAHQRCLALQKGQPQLPLVLFASADHLQHTKHQKSQQTNAAQPAGWRCSDLLLPVKSN